jgi:hypothetical protein
MKLTPRRINIEDLKGAPNWAPSLVNSVNLSQEDVVTTVNGRLEIGTNVSGQIYSCTFSTLAGYSTGSWTPLSFNFTGQIRPQVVVIGSITQTSPSAILLTSQSVQWLYNNSTSPGQIKINYISGLQNSAKYSVTFIVL